MLLKMTVDYGEIHLVGTKGEAVAQPFAKNVRITLLTSLLLMFALVSVSHARRSIFTPDGTLLYRSEGDTFMSIVEAMETFRPGIPYTSHILWDDNFDGSVAFKLLTDEPLLVFIHGEESEDEQRAMVSTFINSFDYAEYLTGWELAFDLKTTGIEFGLGDICVLESLGNPTSYTERTTAAGSISLIGYQQYGLLLTVINGRLAEALEVR